MNVSLSPHARVRMQQRGICAEALETLLGFGTSSSAPGGREIVFFDKAERVRLEQIRRAMRNRDRLHGLYAITEGHGTVITVGHRYRRIARHQGA